MGATGATPRAGLRPAMPGRGGRRAHVLPGFGLALGVTLTYLSLLVLLPLGTLFFRGAELGPRAFFELATSPRALAAYGLSFGASLAAACVNAVFGVILAWVLVRYRFPGRQLVDALVDLPFALPTAVGGIALTAIYAESGPVGRLLEPLGIRPAFSRLGVVVALVFVGLPFVVRTVQPVLEELDLEQEEAAAILGAGRLATFVRVVLPPLGPAITTGAALAFARALGEYGSVVFISGNMPMRTEVVPLLIMTKLEQFDYASATALGVVMLVSSFSLLLLVNRMQAWSGARAARG